MDYGGKTTYGDLLLHTNSYTLEEVELLVSVLNQKWNLVCKVSQRRPNQWAILIPTLENVGRCRYHILFTHQLLVYSSTSY